MTLRTFLTLVLVGFCLVCGWLVVETGIFSTPNSPQPSPADRGLMLLQQTTEVPGQSEADVNAAPVAALPEPVAVRDFGAIGGDDQNITIGSADPDSEFQFALELASKGAAIRKVTFSAYDDRDHKDPKPLAFLSPVKLGNGTEILSMANTTLVLEDQQRQLSLDRLSWKLLGIEQTEQGGKTATFEATITDPQDRPFLKLTKSYTIAPETFLLQCAVTIENLSDARHTVRYNLNGPHGLGREAIREDMRKIVTGFRNTKDEVVRGAVGRKALFKAWKEGKSLPVKPKNGGGRFLWAGATNKYFAAIVVPIPDTGQEYCNWLPGQTGSFFNPDGDTKANTGDETIGLNLSIAAEALEPAGQTDSAKTYDFQIYLGPKDKSLFDKNEMYSRLGFKHTIDFRGCCCPSSIINPLAFGILWIMKAMHGFIPNYGVVIIILVFFMRLIMHPITKKSQISMSKMSKLAPRAEEIKKKYANNKTELNKKLMELYREQGASPITGMLPMFVQMPIWIALWSAVYTSIDLRGAAFLPFWITDLSVPDALIRFSTITVPLLGWKIESLNLLPLMMGVAFYMQQKLMPTQANASGNSQMAQQQKMMMIMMPLLFPLMLYKAPSGVNLYIMASTFAGVIEQKVIRKHIRDKEEQESQGLVAVTSKTGGKVKKKKPKPFFKN